MNKEFTNYNIEELCVDPKYQRQGGCGYIRKYNETLVVGETVEKTRLRVVLVPFQNGTTPDLK